MAGLEALQQIKADLAAQAEREKAEKLAALLAARRLEAQRNMFANAVGKVQPLPATARVDLKQVAPAAAVLQHELDAQAALAESLSDEMDITSLLDTDAQLSFRRAGVGVDVVQKLRQGKWSIQRQVDLHGQRSDEARETLSRFIRDAHKQGLRCVRVVHGKGLGSGPRGPVLKGAVNVWLRNSAAVLAFSSARPVDGGTGALYVLLGRD